MVMNSLRFCVCGNVFISPSLWKAVLEEIGFLVDIFFLFSTLNTSAHCPLASKVSDAKSARHRTEDPLDAVSCFSPAAFKILSVLSLEVLVTLCLSVGLFEFTLTWRSSSLLDVYVHVFYQVWEVLSHNFFRYSLSLSLSLSSSGTP